ncbi:MAG: hypothetical protein Q9170_003815, partial [Blastenia crenularia]
EGRVLREPRVEEEVDGKVQVDMATKDGMTEQNEQQQQMVVDKVDKLAESMEEAELAKTPGTEKQIEQAIDEEIISEKGRMVMLQEKLNDLFSERRVTVRQWDLTALALEGAAAGVTIAGLIALLLRPR